MKAFYTETFGMQLRICIKGNVNLDLNTYFLKQWLRIKE